MPTLSLVLAEKKNASAERSRRWVGRSAVQILVLWETLPSEHLCGGSHKDDAPVLYTGASKFGLFVVFVLSVVFVARIL